MPSFVEIKDAIDEMGKAFEAYKETNDARIEALEKGDDSKAAELGEKLEKIEPEVSKWSQVKEKLEREVEFQRERIEELEAQRANPGKTAAEKIQDEYNETFEAWVRAKGQDASLESKMQELSRQAKEHKEINIGTPASGGYAVPEQIARQIEQRELQFSPVRRLVKVVPVSTSDYKELVNLRGAASGWVGEQGSRSETGTPELREVTPTHGELYAYPQVSEWALDDAFFNVDGWLTDEVAQEFALQEGSGVISGNGTNKMTGMLNTDPALTGDDASPKRAAAAYQYIACDADPDTSPSAAGLRGDCLIDLIYALNSAYRAGATWVMNSATTGAVRKLKDDNGQYHWAPGLQAGQPATLLGYPVETWEQMPDIAADAFPIAFGDFRRGYLLVNRTGMRITRDNVTNPGFVRFYVRRREGGIVLNNDAIKMLRTVT